MVLSHRSRGRLTSGRRTSGRLTSGHRHRSSGHRHRSSGHHRRRRCRNTANVNIDVRINQR